MFSITEDQFRRIEIKHLDDNPVVARSDLTNAAEQGYRAYCLHGLDAQNDSPWTEDNFPLHKAYCRGIRAAWRQEGLDRAIRDL
jgi:hypothetical protein